MNHLQVALSRNMIFSSLSGLVLILWHKTLAGIFGLDSHAVFWITGIVLLFFAFTIWYERQRQRRIAVIWICIQDFLWVVASIVLLALDPFQISSSGQIIIGVIASIVLYLGVTQLRALNVVKN